MSRPGSSSSESLDDRVAALLAGASDEVRGADPETLAGLIRELAHRRDELERENCQLRQGMARKERINAVLATIRNVSQLVVAEDSARRLIERACVCLTESMGYHSAWIALLGEAARDALDSADDGAVLATASAVPGGGFARLRERLARGEFPDCMQAALASGETFVTDAPGDQCHACPLAAEYGGCAGVARGLRFADRSYGVLSVSVPDDYARDPEEQALFRELADDLGFALHRIATGRELRASQRDLRRAQSMVRMGFWRFDLGAGTATANEEARAIYGIADREWTIAAIQTVPLPEYRQRLDAALTALVEEGRPYDVVFRIRRPSDGAVCDIRSVAEYDREQRVVFGTIQDVTDARRHLERIALLGLMLDESPAVIVVHDHDGKTLYANREAVRLHGYADEREFLDLGLRDLDVPWSAALVAERLRQIDEHGEARFEVAHYCKDGTTIPLEIIARTIEWHGQPAILSMGIDIRDRKAAEASMRLQSLVLDQITDLVTVTDLDGTITYVNQAELGLLGYPKEELVGKTVGMYGEDPTRGASQREIVETTRRQGQWRGEIVNRRADGRELILDCRTRLVHDERGTPVALCGIATDITARKRAEEEIRRHAERLRTIVEILQHHHDDLQGFLDYALNKAVSLTRSRFGYIYFYDEVRREFTLNSWSKDVMPSCSVAHPQTRYELARTGIWGEAVRQRMPILLNDFQGENPLKKGYPEGHVPLSRFLTVPVFHQDAIVAVVGVANKETDYGETDTLELTLLMDAVWKSVETLRGEQALRESEERNRLLSDVTMEGILIHRQGVAVDVNPSLARMVGFSREELLGNDFLTLIHPDDLGTALENMTKEAVQPYVIRVMRKDGSWFFAEVESRDFEREGERLRVSAVRDVSRRLEALNALKESEERFRQVYEHMAVGVARVGLDFRIQAANAAYCGMLGYSEEELVGKHLRDITRPEVVEENLRLQEQLCRGEIPHYRMEKTFVHRDGHPVHGILDASLVHDAAGKASYFLGSVVDITEARKAEQEHEKLRAQLVQAQRMESVGRLAGGVAHDFNNMLNVILGHAEMVLDDLPEASPLRADILEIQKAGQRSAQLTRQLLAFARRQTVAPKVLDLNETVAEMLSMLGRLIGEDIDLLWKPGHALEPVRIDPAQVDQILANLCVNARDAIGHRPGKITIETGSAEFDDAYCADHFGFAPGTFALLAVSDDGCGMDAETKANIFEPFFTTKGVGEGTGLGLATVYGIVKQNGGFVSVYSEVGEGTSFHIYLPVHVAPCGARPAQAGSSPPPAVGSETVLLVEDEPTILKMVAKMLERLGYTVLAAKLPGEAIRMAREHSGDIHLLLIDVVMPEMNGRDLAQSLLALRPDLKRLFMSGYTSNVIAHHGVLEEGVSFIQKPFSQRVLGEKLRQVLGK